MTQSNEQLVCSRCDKRLTRKTARPRENYCAAPVCSRRRRVVCLNPALASEWAVQSQITGSSHLTTSPFAKACQLTR